MADIRRVSPFALRTAHKCDEFEEDFGSCGKTEDEHLYLARLIQWGLADHQHFLLRLLRMLKKEGNLNLQRHDWITALEYHIIDITPLQTSPLLENEYKYGGWVYFIQCRGFVKIGLSTDVEARLKALQTACPYPLVLLKKLRVPDPDKAEARLHVYFEDQRRTGEWFELTDEDIADVMSLDSIDLKDLDRANYDNPAVPRSTEDEILSASEVMP